MEHLSCRTRADGLTQHRSFECTTPRPAWTTRIDTGVCDEFITLGAVLSGLSVRLPAGVAGSILRWCRHRRNVLPVNWTAVGVTTAVAVFAATVGNLFIPKASLQWFRALRGPRWMVSFRVFITVGIAYYLAMATVLYRALDREDPATVAWSIVVLVANEAWNAVFFGLRSAVGGFVGMLAFAVTLAGLVLVARADNVSLVLLALYSVWVAYDVAWTFSLWQLNKL